MSYRPAQRIAELTGTAEGAYVGAGTGPGSKDSCAVELSLVESKTLKPIVGGYRIGVDTTTAAGNTDNPPQYVIGTDINTPNGPFFSGGGLREQRGQRPHLPAMHWKEPRRCATES